MADFIGERECVTHFACGCIQARLARYEAALRYCVLDCCALYDENGPVQPLTLDEPCEACGRAFAALGEQR